jgi:hypothetical protein
LTISCYFTLGLKADELDLNPQIQPHIRCLAPGAANYLKRLAALFYAENAHLSQNIGAEFTVGTNTRLTAVGSFHHANRISVRQKV